MSDIDTQESFLQETEQELAKRLEAYQTPEWAVRAMLEREILTQQVVDPCAGRGVMGKIAREYDYHVCEWDIYPWIDRVDIQDFLRLDNTQVPHSFSAIPHTVLMNPPFSSACDFVRQAFHLGARKVVCFQRFAWWESAKRRDFWKEYSPNRIYICGDRATCLRFDIADTYKDNTPTAHAWYVWEAGHPAGTQLSHIYKSDV